MTAFSIPLFVLCIPLGNLIIDLAGHASAVKAAERGYLLIAAPGGILTVLNAVLAGVLTGQGRTRYASFSLICGCVVNLLLDPIIIFGHLGFPALGIQGAALATVGSFTVSMILLARRAFQNPLVREAGREAFRLNLPRLLTILRFGAPAGLCAVISSASFLVFTMSVGKLDGLSFAASNTVFAVNNVFFLATQAVSQGVTILTGRYHGAGDSAATRRVFRSGLVLTGLSLAFCFALILPNTDFVMDLFRGKNSSLDPTTYRQIGQILFLIMFVREIAEGIALVAAGALKGVGDTTHVMLSQATVDLLVRLPLILVASTLSQSIVPLWLTMPVSLGLLATLLVRRWRSDSWRTIRLAD